MVTVIKHILDKYFKNNLNPTLKDCKDYVESIDKNEFLKYASSSYVKQFVKEKENNNIDITLPTNKICRTKLYENKNYEIILISWLPGAKSHIHNHSDNGCLYRVIDGTLIEEQYHPETLELIKLQNILPNDVDYIDNTTSYHRMINQDKTMAYSLHIYSPPNFDMTIY
tara:strand:+ start:73 stop:579 length:507 start_codon:yes stop_codon:yes gene_type:complete